jgi:hypothetical protein
MPTAGAYNSRYGRRGHAFAGRYGSEEVTSDEQLLSTYRYIARNPVEAGICPRPQDRCGSSFQARRFAASQGTNLVA